MTASISKWVTAVGSRKLRLLAVVGCALSFCETLRASVPDKPLVSAEAQGASAIRTSLASVSASAFQPGVEPMLDVAALGVQARTTSLNVPAPGALSPAKPAVDHIPEPGTIGFGLAIAALVAGNFAKSVRRCWKITGGMPERES